MIINSQYLSGSLRNAPIQPHMSSDAIWSRPKFHLSLPRATGFCKIWFCLWSVQVLFVLSPIFLAPKIEPVFGKCSMSVEQMNSFKSEFQWPVHLQTGSLSGGRDGHAEIGFPAYVWALIPMQMERDLLGLSLPNLAHTEGGSGTRAMCSKSDQKRNQQMRKNTC